MVVVAPTITSPAKSAVILLHLTPAPIDIRTILDIEFVQVPHLLFTVPLFTGLLFTDLLFTGLLFTVEMLITALVLIIITFHGAVDMVVEEILADIETLHLHMFVVEQVAGQLAELSMGLAFVLDLQGGMATVEVIQMFVLGREIGFVPIPCVVILILQGETIVTHAEGLVLHPVEVLGGLILPLHHFMLLLDAFLDLQWTVPQKGL